MVQSQGAAYAPIRRVCKSCGILSKIGRCRTPGDPVHEMQNHHTICAEQIKPQICALA